jgi:uncharacterized membrane protein YkoI
VRSAVSGPPGEAPPGINDPEDNMRRFITSVVAVSSLVLLASVAASAQEEEVPLDKVPKVVLDAVKAKYPNAKLEGASTETENGQKVYEVAITEKGAHIDVTLTPEGKITLVEKEIEAKDLPREVVEALIDKHPGATVKLAEEMSDGAGKVQAYELKIVTAENKVLELKFDPKGKTLDN